MAENRHCPVTELETCDDTCYGPCNLLRGNERTLEEKKAMIYAGLGRRLYEKWDEDDNAALHPDYIDYAVARDLLYDAKELSKCAP